MNNKSSVDSIIKFCHKQMDNDTSIHKGVYLSIIKFCEQQAKEMHKQEIYQHAIEFYFFATNDEVTDQAVEYIEDLYKNYLKQFYNETFGK